MKSTAKPIAVPGKLGALLRAQGFRAHITLTRDGSPPSPSDMKRARRLVAAFASLEARVDATISAVTRALASIVPDAETLPSPAILAAVVTGGGIARPKRAGAQAPRAKRSVPKTTAKRPKPSAGR